MNKTPPKLPATKPPTLSNDSPSSDNDNLWLITVLSGLGLLLLIMLALFFLLRQDMTGGADSVAETTSNETMDHDSSEESTTDDTKEEANETEDDNQAPESLTEDAESAAEPTDSNLPSEENMEELEELPRLNPDLPSGVIVGGFGKGRGKLFGLEFRGDRIAYIIDYSPSMTYPFGAPNLNRLQKAQQELIASVGKLNQDQIFTVLLFNDVTFSSPDFIKKSANKKTPSELQTWLKTYSAGGSTNPIPAMQQILEDDYDIVFLVSDGEFSAWMVDEIKRLNKKNIVINTVSLSVESLTLKQIAKENQGKYITAR